MHLFYTRAEQEETNTKQRTLSWTQKHSQAIHRRYLYFQRDKHKRWDSQPYEQPESKTQSRYCAEILNSRCFCNLQPTQFALHDLRFSPFDGDQCIELWRIPNGKVGSLLLLFTPTSHSRGNWKKSKRLNLISGWEKQRERGKNAKKNPALENLYK